MNMLMTIGNFITNNMDNIQNVLMLLLAICVLLLGRKLRKTKYWF